MNTTNTISEINKLQFIQRHVNLMKNATQHISQDLNMTKNDVNLLIQN